MYNLVHVFCNNNLVMIILIFAVLGLWLIHTQHTTVLRTFWILSGTTRVCRHQKGKTHNQEGKTSLDLLEQEIVSGSSISWAICKSAP